MAVLKSVIENIIFCEKFITYYFSDCYANLGGGLDSKSGIFTTPLAGAYLFVIHVCSADMSKALLAIR